MPDTCSYCGADGHHVQTCPDVSHDAAGRQQYNPAGPIRRAIDGATSGRTILGDRTVGTRPKTREERLPHQCAGCGARYAGEEARDGCCIANAFVEVFDDDAE